MVTMDDGTKKDIDLKVEELFARARPVGGHPARRRLVIGLVIAALLVASAVGGVALLGTSWPWSPDAQAEPPAPGRTLDPPERSSPETFSRSNAARFGGSLESLVQEAMERNGFVPVRHADWAADPGRYDGDLLLLDAPYTTIYGTRGRTEFLAVSPRLPGPTRIEAKWQQVSGSTDEKLPYLYLNAADFPEARVVIVIDGGGWRDGALAWLRRAAAAAPEGKTIRVMDLAGFLAWANRL